MRSGNTNTTGWLVARVDGAPRDIQYSLNGVRLEPEERIEWWKDAAIRLQLRPGLYELAATYRVRAFAGRGIEYRIVSRTPIDVRSGGTTEVEAHLEKDWRGVPANETAYFVVVTEERRQRKEQAEAAAASRQDSEDAAPAAFSSTSVPMTVDPQPTPEMLAEIQGAEAAAPVTDTIVIHGDQAGTGSGSVTIQNAEAAPAAAQQGSADNIRIRGPESTSSPAGTGLSPAAVGLGVGAAATLPGQTSAPPEPAPAPEPVLLEGSEEFGITVRIESVPSGAEVVVDDQRVGTTPVHVRMDPRADHIVEFAHDGCGDYVRLLSSSSWREGRDTSVQVQLYCND